jgi:hypothetical protein
MMCINSVMDMDYHGVPDVSKEVKAEVFSDHI